MDKLGVVQQTLAEKLVAVVRSPDGGRLVEVAKALRDGGVRIMEITLTVPSALDVIKAVNESLKDQILLGAGTVLDPETARAAILAGARFIVSPTLNLEVIRVCQRYGAAIFPGAFTPTEILTAWENGADIVKVFPADIGGPNYLKAIHGPLPQIKLMPTGGVDLNTAAAFLKAGACALGLGSALVDKKAIEEGDLTRLRGLAEQYVAIVKETGGK